MKELEEVKKVIEVMSFCQCSYYIILIKGPQIHEAEKAEEFAAQLLQVAAEQERQIQEAVAAAEVSLCVLSYIGDDY